MCKNCSCYWTAWISLSDWDSWRWSFLQTPRLARRFQALFRLALGQDNRWACNCKEIITSICVHLQLPKVVGFVSYRPTPFLHLILLLMLSMNWFVKSKYGRVAVSQEPLLCLGNNSFGTWSSRGNMIIPWVTREIYDHPMGDTWDIWSSHGWHVRYMIIPCVTREIYDHPVCDTWDIWSSHVWHVRYMIIPCDTWDIWSSHVWHVRKLIWSVVSLEHERQVMY